MRAGLVLDTAGEPDGIADEARAAERLGFDLAAATEHVFFEGPVSNAFVSLAAAAAVTDRIRLRWFSQDPDVVAALTEYAGLIAREVLAVEVLAADPDTAREHVEGDLGLTFWLGRI